MKRGSRDRTVHRRTGGPKTRTYVPTATSAATVRTPATSVLNVFDADGTARAAALRGLGFPLRGDLGGHLRCGCDCGSDRLGRPGCGCRIERLWLDDRVLGDDGEAALERRFNLGLD